MAKDIQGTGSSKNSGQKEIKPCDVFRETLGIQYSLEDYLLRVCDVPGAFFRYWIYEA